MAPSQPQGGETSELPTSIRPGDVLADRYLLVDLLSESGTGRFWRAHDRILDRHVSIHVIGADDARADGLMEAARRSATVPDRRILRVLDVDRRGDLCYVVNEWGSGTSLDILVAADGVLDGRRAAWIVSEVAESIAAAHDAGVAHGRLVPENVLIDQTGSVRLIGLCVDAALLGLPAGRVTSDVTDLAALLYFLLTAKWPGVSRSGVPAAPHENGRVLRPRRVKAGVQRPLDSLCDQVLNPYAATGGSQAQVPLTATGICDSLRDFVGDPAGLAEAEAASGRHRVGPPPPAWGLAAPAPPPPDPEPDPEPDPSPATPETTDQPTEAGLPIFDDERDEVSWFAARPGKPPPPPPFEEPPERPLFAPEPPAGEPVRKARPGAAATPEYWPWDTAAGAGSGSGVIAVTDDEDEDDEVPGRSWLRLAGALAASCLLLLAIIFAFNLGRGRSPLGSEESAPDPTPSSPSATGAPAAITGVTATDLDPQGDPPEENGELAPLAVDGDPTTAWHTLTYEQDLGPTGLKTGVGLSLDLGSPEQVTDVELTLVGSPSDVAVYVTDEEPTNVEELTPVAEETVEETQERITLDEPATGRFLVVWFTSLPSVEGGFRGEVSEIVARG